MLSAWPHRLALLASWASQPTGSIEDSSHGHSANDHVSGHEASEPTGTFGLSPPMYAWLLATASGLSLVIGAILGCRWAPVSDLACSAQMAFGAGALLFAVTIELYAHALHQLSANHILFVEEMCVILVCAIVGALFYLYINKALEDYLMGTEDDKEETAQLGQAIQGNSAGKSSSTPRDRKRQSSVMASLEETAALGMHHNKTTRDTGTHSSGSRIPGETYEEKKARLRKRAKQLWKKVRAKLMFIAKVKVQVKNHARGRERGLQELLVVCQKWSQHWPFQSSPEDDARQEIDEEDPEREEIVKHAKLVALQLFLGLLVDGVPEAILMGFLAAKGQLTPVLIIALFFANFPEAFSSASLLSVGNLPMYGIVGMWSFLCIMVGIIAGIACWTLLAIFPGYATGAVLPTPVLMGIAAIEGLAGGAMIACISHVMLPEAFERMGKACPIYLSSGFMCTTGFLCTVFLKAVTG